MVVSTLAGLVSVRAHDISRAERPWSAALEARSADPRMRAMAYAILAPNAFNLQPWLVELPGDDMLILRCDLALRLPEADANDRMTTITFGNFLELLRMAAAQDGYRLAIEPFPMGQPRLHLDERPIAAVQFIRGGAAVDPLFPQVPDRRTSKRPFEPQPVANAILKQVASVAATSARIRSSTDRTLVGRIRSLPAQAYEIEKRTARINQEQSRVTRIGLEEIEACPDGIDLQGPDVEAAKSHGQLSRVTLDDPESAASKQQIASYRVICDTTNAYIWLSTFGNTRLEQLDAGRDWLRIQLKTTELGLSFEPQSPALNDYAEVAQVSRTMHDTLAVPAGHRVQMLSRVGYAAQMPPSVRWPAETKVLKT